MTVLLGVWDVSLLRMDAVLLTGVVPNAKWASSLTTKLTLALVPAGGVATVRWAACWRTMRVWVSVPAGRAVPAYEVVVPLWGVPVAALTRVVCGGRVSLITTPVASALP